MEDVLETIKRINDMWEKEDDKRTILAELGFPTKDASFLNFIGSYVTSTFTQDVMIYEEAELKQGRTEAEAVLRSVIFALADAALVFMMLGRERERLFLADDVGKGFDR